MTPEQLRTSILHYAFSGKLVPQNEEEGTGESLYEQIQEERNRLTKEGRIKKEKALPNCEDVELPASWKLCKLGNCIDLLSGQDLPSNRYNDKKEGIVYLTGASNIDDNGNVIINRWTSSPTSVARKGSLLLTCKGTIGKTCILDIEEAHIARQIMAITEILIDIHYLKYFIEISILELQRRAKSMIPGIDRDTVRCLDFPLPPLEEQHRIVAKIEELLPYVDQYSEAYEKLEQFNDKFPEDMKKSILQYAIRGKLVEQRPEEGTAEDLYQQIQEEKRRLIKEGKIKKEKPLAEISEDEIPFDIPDTWKWVRLGELIKVQNGYAYKSEEMNKEGIGMPVIKSGNLMSLKVELKARNDYIESPTEKMLESKIIQGDMLMCLSSQSDNPEPLGKTAIYENSEPALLNQRVLKMRPYTEEMTKYLYYVINSQYFHYTVSHQGGGSAQANLKMAHVLNMLIPLPPILEQKRLVSKIEETMPYCARLTR